MSIKPPQLHLGIQRCRLQVMNLVRDDDNASFSKRTN